MLDLDPNRAPPPPRAAATTLVLRDGASGLEVLCIVRHPKSTFLGGMVAFPGGKVDAADGAPAWLGRTNGLSPRLTALEGLPASPLALAVAGCREVLEEAALLPVAGRALVQTEAIALRESLKQSTFEQEIARLGVTLDTRSLVPFARWVTPEAEARRYDATFFVLALPEAQEGASDNHETTSIFWSRPADVIDRWGRGELQLAPPTTRSLELLATCDTVRTAVSFADTQILLPICPRYVPDESGGYLCLPGDPSHEIATARAAGPSRFVLREGRFVSAEPSGAPPEK